MYFARVERYRLVRGSLKHFPVALQGVGESQSSTWPSEHFAPVVVLVQDEAEAQQYLDSKYEVIF